MPPKGNKVFHKTPIRPTGFFSGKARSLQNVARSDDSLSHFDFFQTGPSVENADANLGLENTIANSVKLVEDPKLAEEARKHQEKVKKNVQEVYMRLASKAASESKVKQT